MHRYTVIGITDAPRPYLAPEVAAIVAAGRVFSGGRRHHELVAPLLPPGHEWIDITVPVEDVIAAYERRPGSDDIIIFASGDPLFFGFAVTLRRLLPGADVRVFPAFNSLQMLAHRLLMPYHDMRIVSLTGRPWAEFDRALIERASKVGVLTDRTHTPAAIARRMLDYGYAGYVMHVGQHLGNPAAERVDTLSLGEAAGSQFAMPNCLIIEATPAVPVQAGGIAATPQQPPFGIPDDAFALLDGRAKMITKMPIRLLTLQALDLTRRSVMWDIGACTGSVSIEARLRFPHLRVEAFEIRPECEAIILENARRLGAPGISLHIGDFRAVCTPASCDHDATPAAPSAPTAPPSPTAAALPEPDAVFIGGHGGHLHDIMAIVARRLLPGGVIVMNSVTSHVVEQQTGHRPSSRQLWDAACEALGLDQLPPMRILLNDNNPIEILKCRKSR